MWRIVIRSWWANPGRASATILSVALGVAAIIITTSFNETARRTIADQVLSRWLGSSHLSIQPAGAHWGALEADLADAVTKVPNVQHVAARLQRRMNNVDAVGIDPAAERNFRRLPDVQGRMIEPDERGVAVMEAGTAKEWEIPLGGELILVTRDDTRRRPLKVIGLFESQRVADFQRPVVYAALPDIQELTNEPGKASSIDMMLADNSSGALEETKRAVEELIRQRGDSYRYRVESSAAAQSLFQEAERLSHLFLTLIAFVVMLTSFFIILTTMSVSLFARRAQLGILRCVGLTRGGLAKLVFVEVLPLGVIGTGLGIALGKFALWAIPHWLMHADFSIPMSQWGRMLAVSSGILTVLVSCAILSVQVARVAPLTAIAPLARPARRWLALLCGPIALILLALHETIVRSNHPDRLVHPAFVGTGAAAVFLGYIALAPLLVVTVGPVVARGAGRLLGLRSKLAAEAFTKSPWRSTGVCWMLQVGLALIVYTAVNMEVLRSIWSFPNRLPEAFVWSQVHVPGHREEQIRQWPTVRRMSTVVDVDCTIQSHAPAERADSSWIEKFLSKLTRPVFIAGEPDRLFDVLKVQFVQGSQQDAQQKLAQGGHVLVPTQTAKQHNLKLDDMVTISIRDRSAEFTVAGVIQSPAMDLAITAFQANSYMQFAAASAIIGTRSDLREKFDLDVFSLVLLDLNLPETLLPPSFLLPEPPEYGDNRVVARAMIDWASFLPEEHELLEQIAPALRGWLDTAEDTPVPAELERALRRYGRSIRALFWYWKKQTPEESWHRFRERLVLFRIAERMERPEGPEAILGSLRRLKRDVQTFLQRATVVLTWLPSIILAVAAVGIANLMMVSVQLRAPQFAVLRAIGALKSQVVRLVLAEAMAIGAIGSVIGIALGLHLAASDNRITEALVGFKGEFVVPAKTILIGVTVTVGVCLIAGVGPARRAARNNITTVLQAT